MFSLLALLFWFAGIVRVLSTTPSSFLRHNIAAAKVFDTTSAELQLAGPAGIDTKANVTASVRGNLGPPEVILNDGEDWIRDRWQAASNMHGKAIHGEHWIRLKFSDQVKVRAVTRIVLDWEAAYCDDYFVKLSGESTSGDSWSKVVYDGSKKEQRTTLLSVTESNESSPGVKDKNVKLHVIHELGPFGNEDPDPEVTVKEIQLTMRKPASHGWGVSLWQIKAFGRF